jgi:hypothetical protein
MENRCRSENAGGQRKEGLIYDSAMKFLFRWAFRLLILALALAIGLVLTKDKLLKEMVQTRIRQQTGMDVRIGQLETGLIYPTIHLNDVTVFNTAEFGGSPFLVIPDLYLEYDRKELGLQRLRLNLVRLEVANINVVQNEQGRTNIQKILAETTFTQPVAGKTEGKPPLAFQALDRLNLTVRKVTYTDLKNPRRSQEIPIQLKNEVINNLRSEEDFYGVLLKIFLRAGIPLGLDARQQILISGPEIACFNRF